MELPSVTVIIPAFRAERHIADVIATVPEFVRHIVVVDDLSPDGTADAVTRLKDPRVTLVRHADNQGVGGAMITGYNTALELGAEILVKMDSDGQMDPRHLLRLIAPIVNGEADYAKGNRFLHLRELSAMPLKRRVGNAGLSFLTKLASGYWNIFDPTNGYTAMHAAAYRQLDQAKLSRRYFFESSLLLELSAVRAVVTDVAIPARYADEKSSLSELDALVSFPGKLLAGFFRRILLQYFIRDFTAFSMLLVTGLLATGFGTIWGAVHWYLSAVHGIPATTGTVMIAALPWVVGTQLLLQAIQADIQNVPRLPIQAESEALQSVTRKVERRPLQRVVGDE